MVRARIMSAMGGRECGMAVRNVQLPSSTGMECLAVQWVWSRRTHDTTAGRVIGFLAFLSFFLLSAAETLGVSSGNRRAVPLSTT